MNFKLVVIYICGVGILNHVNAAWIAGNPTAKEDELFERRYSYGSGTYQQTNSGPAPQPGMNSDCDCLPDILPNLSMLGFCASVTQLDSRCTALEVSSSRNCTDFEGNFCCYKSIEQGNTFNGSITTVIPTVIPSTVLTTSAGSATVTRAGPSSTGGSTSTTTISSLAGPVEPSTPAVAVTSERTTLSPGTSPQLTSATTQAIPATVTSATTTVVATSPAMAGSTSQSMDSTTTATSTASTTTSTTTTTTATTTTTTTTPTTTTTTTTPTTTTTRPTTTTTTPTTTTTTTPTTTTTRPTTTTTTPTTTTTTTPTTTTTTTPTTTTTTTTPTTTTTRPTTTTTTPTTTTTTTTTTTSQRPPTTGSIFDTSRPEVQQVILDLHNELRSFVGASNMLEMQWDSVAAEQAQRWADRCVAEHGPDVRTSSLFGSCGQNIANGNGIRSWNTTMRLWGQNERDLFTFNQTPCPEGWFHTVGHYTQIVWASSFQVGCGFNSCPGTRAGNFFVCNYCPPGNAGNVCTPYEAGSSENGGVCGRCGGSSDPRCRRGLCTNPCPVTNQFSNCDRPVPSNPSMFPALIGNTAVCRNNPNDQFVLACRASCQCRDQGLLY